MSREPTSVFRTGTVLSWGDIGEGISDGLVAHLDAEDFPP